MPLLPLTDDLIQTTPFDRECAELADRHYSRQSPGSPQFMGNGRKLVLRDMDGAIVFGWLWSEYRADGEDGFNCAIFRNEGERLASGIILEAEEKAVEKWGPNRAFTFIDPREVKPTFVRNMPVWGFCFYKAGWRFKRVTRDGKYLLEKQLRKVEAADPQVPKPRRL
jgi:hypothetical protein